MFNLITLEMKKFKIQGFIKAAVITHLALLIFLQFVVIILKVENEPIEEIIEVSNVLINSMGTITFVIFASVMLGKIVIGEYSNKTINLMFMYPVSRKKIVISKLIIVSVFTFINIIISNILLTSLFIIINSVFNVFTWQPSLVSIITKVPTLLLNAILASGTALIPLYFGMKKKSVSTTIISGVLITAVMHSSNGTITISSILPITITAAVIGLLVGVGTLNKLDVEDVI